MLVRIVDAFEMRYIREMKEHCEKGMRVPTGDSKRVILDRKVNLLLTVNEFLGSLIFEQQRKEFAEHTFAFADHHGLEVSEKARRPPVSESDIPTKT